MPKLDGLGFLKTVRADARWEQLPGVMLTTNVTRESISQAMSHKISGFLLKSKFSMPEMLARVHTAILRGKSSTAPIEPPPAPKPAAAAAARPAPAPKPPAPPAPEPIRIPNLVSRDSTLAALADFKSTKPLSGVIAQIAVIASAPKSTPAEMAVVVRQDPVLAARVVHLAATQNTNGRKTRLASVDDAVRAVGVEAVRDLAASMQPITAFPDGPANGLGMLRCWSHALAVSAIMGQIVPSNEAVPPSLPQLIGLCHDLTEIVLRQSFPNEFTCALDFAAQAGVPIATAITSVFGISHAEATEALFQNLKFPTLIAAPIIEFAINSGKAVDAHKGMLARSLAICDFLAHGMLLASSTDAMLAPVSLADCRSMLIPTSSLNFPEIRSEAVTTVCMLAKLSAEAEALFLKPMIDRNDAGISYARHPSFAALDPIFVALINLANAQILDKQHPVDTTTLQRLAVISPSSHLPFMSDAVRACTQSGLKVPVLHIVTTTEARPPGGAPDGVSEIGIPFSIDKLHQFISGLKRSDNSR
jgi:HD-like signal output (HDOD) protein